MLERFILIDKQPALFDLEEDTKVFPSSYLKINNSRLITEIDIAKLSGVKLFAERWEKKWQDEVGVMAKGIVDFSNLIIQEHPDTILLLDKSARPISHFLKSLWKYSYPGCQTPDIRFINIGREYSRKYYDKKQLTQLYYANLKYMNYKKVIVADEVIEKGDTIKRARETIKKIFPNTQRLLFTSVFGADLPFWYSGSFHAGIGVFDRLMPNDILGDISEKKEQDTFFAKTVTGVARRHEQIKNAQNYDNVKKDTQEQINKLRFEINYLAEKISNNCQKYYTKEVVAKPNLPWNLFYLNMGA